MWFLIMFYMLENSTPTKKSHLVHSGGHMVTQNARIDFILTTGVVYMIIHSFQQKNIKIFKKWAKNQFDFKRDTYENMRKTMKKTFFSWFFQVNHELTSCNWSFIPLEVPKRPKMLFTTLNLPKTGENFILILFTRKLEHFKVPWSISMGSKMCFEPKNQDPKFSKSWFFVFFSKNIFLWFDY